MTKLEALALIVARCDAAFEEQLAAAEIVLLDLGGTTEEVAGAIGPSGYARKMLQEDRDAQIAAVVAWLTGNDGTLH
jgi:hypothetical protein